VVIDAGCTCAKDGDFFVVDDTPGVELGRGTCKENSLPERCLNCPYTLFVHVELSMFNIFYRLSILSVLAISACATAPAEIPNQPNATRAPVAPSARSEAPRRLPIPTAQTPAAVPSLSSVGCESPVGSEPAGADGCALLTGVRRNLQFVGDSAQLAASSASSVAGIASTLASSPELRIEIRAHAQASDGIDASQELSRQRAVAVARALVDAGIAVNRLSARAFGNTELVVTEGSSAGELLPNRIEFMVQR